MSDVIGVYCLDVGQGDCTFVVGPGPDPELLLFDCADEFVARRFMLDHEYERLSAMVISHQDLDHIKGVVPLLSGLLERGGSIGCVWIDDDRLLQTDAGRQLFAFLLEREGEHSLTLRTPTVEDGPKLVVGGPDWTVQLILPTHAQRLRARRRGARGQPNMASAALRVSRGSSSILIGGDAELGAWEALDESLLDAVGFRVPHHGGHCKHGARRWTGYDDLYRRVNPAVAVVSVGTVQAGYGHPQPEHISAVVGVVGCGLMCTQLTTRCHPDPTSRRTTALSQVGSVCYPWRHQLRETEVPCAGSVLLMLNSDGVLESEPAPTGDGWHGRWVRSLEHPLCAASTPVAGLGEQE